MKRIAAIVALAFSFAAFAAEPATKTEPAKAEKKVESVKAEKKVESAKADAKTGEKAATPVKGTKTSKKGGAKKAAAPKADPK